MTQADNAKALRMSLDSDPAPGLRQASDDASSTGVAARCDRCDVYTEDAVYVGHVEQGSGPGASIYACRPHAIAYAKGGFAPTWLRDSLLGGDAE